MFEKAAETYKKKNEAYSGMFQKAAQTYQARNWEEDASQPLDGDSAANNPIAPALILAKRDGNVAAAKELLDNAPYVQAGRDGINSYADAVAEIERQDAAAKATMQPMGYGGLSKALRDGSMPKKKNTKVKETRREGNPKYNDDYVSGVDYPKFRPYDDVEKELADVQARRDTDFNTRFPEAEALVQRSIGGKDADADRQLRELAQQYADENAAYDARIAELKKEVKDSKNKTVLQRREQTAAQTVQAEKARYETPALRGIDDRISALESKLNRSADEEEAAFHKAYPRAAELWNAMESGTVPPGDGAAYLTEYAELQNKWEKQNTQDEAELYALRGAKTLAALSEEDRMAILNGVKARGELDGTRRGEFPAHYFDFSICAYKDISQEKYEEIRAAYDAAIRKLQASGASKADIRRMETALSQSIDAVVAAGDSVADANFALKYPVFASITSIPTNLVSGVSVGVGELGRAVGNAFRGEGYKEPMNINGAAYAPVRATNDIRGTIAERIEEGNGFGGKAGSFVYQTLMSTADSVVSSVLGNVGGAAAIGGSAFASAIVDAKERGVSDEQALMTGICAGIFETLFERISIGNFNKLKEVPPAALRDVALNILKSTGVNASEEGFTEIANIAADCIINGDYSGYAEAYNAYINAGKNEFDATWLAIRDMAKQVGMAAFGGAVQGGFMGGIGSIWGYFNSLDANRAAGAYFTDENGRINAENRNALIGEGLASGNEEIRAYAGTLEDKRTMSQAEAGQLYRMLVAQTQGNYNEVKGQAESGEEQAVSGETDATAQENTPAGVQQSEPRTETPDFSDRSLNEPISETEFRAAYAARVAREAAAERAKTQADADLGNMLSGELTNGRADEIAKSQSLANAFEALTGEKLTGTLAEKRKHLKAMQTFAAEKLRDARADARMTALKTADTREKMRAAVGTAGQAVYDAGYDAGVASYKLRGFAGDALLAPSELYNANFGAYYRQGYRGDAFDFSGNAVIGEADARRIFDAGRRDAEADTYLNAAERSAFEHGVSAEKGATAMRLSQVLGREILFIDADADFHGCTIDGVIYLGAKSDRSVLATVAHEYTHLLEGKGLYKKLRDFVFDTLTGEGATAEDLRASKRAEHELYAGLDDAQIDREIVAEFVETRLLTDEQVMREVVRREGKSFARRLLDTLRGLIEKVKAALHIGNADAEQLKMLERGRDILAEVIRSEEVAEKTAVSFDLEQAAFEKQLDDWKDGLGKKYGSYNGTYFNLGTTPSVLVKHGAKQVPVIMYEDCLVKITGGKHSISLDEIKKLPEQLNDPILLFKGSVPDSFVALTEMETKAGHDVVVAVHINRYLNRTVVNKIASMYSKSTESGVNRIAQYISAQIESGNLVDASAKKAPTWFTSRGLQLPKLVQTIIDADTTVSQKNSGVNSKYTQNSKKDADIDGFSVGGVNAKTAEVGRLADAERMEQGGADSETVRRETGWYRGYDGKWRFEIDDSKMRFINHREESRRTWKLDELIRHDALFAAYPELRNYTVLNFAFEDGINGVFSPGLNRIMLNPNLDRAGKRAALIHEIQHAIQVIEGFAAGSSTDYWQDAFVTDEEKRTERHLLELSRKNRLLEEDMYRLLEDTPDARRDALRATLVKRHGEKAVREFTDTYNHLLNLQKQREMRAEQAYRNTAGEIEAADVANRLGLSAKQRAETRPDIDRTNVRFSQSAGWHHAEYDPETAGIKEQLEHSAETLNAMRTITSVEVPQSFTSKSEAAKWAIETLKRTGYQVERQGYGVIHFNENDIKYGAKYADTAAEKAAFAAIPAVLKRGIEIGGHANHKAREKQTVTFAAPVELNGIRGNMAVVVNKRGDHYYTHRIVLPDGRTFTFSEKNNATRELSRGVTVSGSLAETTSVASKNSISNSAENVNTILKKDAETDADIRFSVGGEQTDAGAEVSDADKRFAPVESAIKLLQGGADLWRTLRETGASPREIALRMATSGESDTAIRELTGLYRDALGVWTYDKAWFDAHVPDIADTRELRAGYKLGTVDEQLLGLAPEEVKASRRRLLDSAKLPADADAARVRQAAANLHRGLRPTAAEFAEDRKTAAAKEAARLITAEKVPSADAAIRTGALLADIADVLEKKKVRAETITRLTAQVRGENGAWETDNAAMTKIIRAGSKQLDVQDFTDFLFENAKELTESSYNSQYGHKETYALDKLGAQIQNPIVDIAKYGTKPSELIANEREQEELKRYIENEYASDAHPTAAERADARDVATGIRTLGQISQDSRREVVLDLVYANLARRGLRDNGIETFYMVQKQRYAEELAQNIFKMSIEPGKKAVQQWRLTANTALRNNRMVFGEEVGRYLNETIFEKVVENEAERQRFMQREIDKIRKLELTKLESQAVQMLAEDTKESRLAFYELLKGKGKNLDVEKCRAAVTVFRECYNLYYDAINEFLVMHGYKPIGFQKNYMPRLQKEADVSALRERLNALGIETEEVTELPAEIAGRTETFKPGKKYNPFFEHRTSKENKNVQYDALGGFDSYITYLSEVLYHTDDIQKLRTLAGALRERYASGAVSKNIAELKEQLYSPDPDKSFADIEAKLNEAYDEVKLNNYFGTYATWLDDYTNNIAGKQSSFDRAFEYNIGRKTLNLGKRLNNTYSAAVIVGNLSSAFNQTVQLPFALTECGIRNMTRAFVDMLPGSDRLNKTAEFDKKSTFLAGKRGVDYASERAWNEKVTAAGGKFFETVDMAVTRLILRAKYYQVTEANPNIGFDAAVREADRYISAMVGNRMKGAKPVLFNQKNVITRTLAAFQLEQLNFVEYVARDVPAKYRAYYKAHGTHATVRKIARELISALINVFVFNRLAELLYGQTPAAGDALGILVDSLGAGWNLTGNDFLLTLADDLCRTMTGERKLGTKERGDFSTQNALGAFGDEVGDDVPLVNNILAMLGVTNSKLPLPQIKAVTKAASGDFKGAAAQIPSDLATWVPFGSQVKKTARGIELIADKGMYSSSGKLMFASDMNLWDCIRAVLFGPTANEEYRESFFGGRYLSAEETALWQQMRAAGGKPEESFGALQDVYNAGAAVREADPDAPSAEVKAAKVEKIDNLTLNGRLKALLLYGDVATTNEKAVMDALEVTLQVDHMKVYRFMSGFVLQEKVADKREYLKHDLILTDAEKATVYYHYFANDDVQDFIDELRRRGGKDADIYKVLAASYGREEEKITSADRATAIADSSLPASAKEEAMYELISDELHDKYTAVQDAGGSVDEFLAAYAATRGITSDKDKAGNTVALSKARKMKKAIDAAVPDTPKKVRRALYSAFGVSKSVWY